MRTSPFSLRRAAVVLPLAFAALLPASGRAADALWTNWGVITWPPQIDAISFENRGSMTIATDLPFETSNTRNYTNSGTMIGTPGWRFATLPSNMGLPAFAENFANVEGGIVQSIDSVRTIVVGDVGIPLTVPFPASYLWVDADNIVNVNNSRLSVGASGWLRLRGERVNLNRGAIEVRPVRALGSFLINETNFIPDEAIYDLYWGQQTVGDPPGRPTSPIWNGSFAQTANHDITLPGGGAQGNFGFAIAPTHADSFDITNFFVRVAVTNIIGLPGPLEPGETLSNLPIDSIVISNMFIPTNVTRQAVFVSVRDPSLMAVDFDWRPSSVPTNLFWTPQVIITTYGSNVIDASTAWNQFFFYDTLASSPVRGLLPNSTSARNFTTYRPTNYVASRVSMLGGGLAGDGWPAGDFLYEPGFFSNNVVAMDMAGYGVFINNLPSDAPSVPAGTVTNLPGRVQIYADNLDLRRTRVRGEGQIIMKTDHLIGSSNAVIDSEHLSFFLTSTNENLRMVDLAKESVYRTRGDVLMWSAVWNNQGTYLTENYIVSTNFDTNTPPAPIDINVTRADVTNEAIFNLHVMIMSADALSPTQPVITWDVVSHSDNLVIEDRMGVAQNFEVDATNFTLNGSITFTNGALSSWIGTTFFAALEELAWTNVPNLMRFTNNGTLTVPSVIHFGDDRPHPGDPMVPLALDYWINNGTVNSSSMLVNSTFYRNSGSIFLTGPLSIEGINGSLEGGQIVADQTRITAQNLRLNDHSLQVRSLTLEVPGNLSDAGAGTDNSIVVNRGFHMLVKPATGDLLGTTLETVLPAFAQIDHTWAGEDRGASVSGFVNNAALGSLIIGMSANALDPLAYFKGTGPGRALYVDFLDIAALGEDWDQWLEIDPNLTIYYATARVDFTIPNLPNGVAQTPEEFLNGKLGGRLRWVPEYAGGLSSVAILVDGVTQFMNSGLRNSRVIDSDNDGVPNYFDPTPLGGSNPGMVAGLMLKSSLVKPNLVNNNKAFSMSWMAAPNTVYQIEVATDLVNADWQPLGLYTNKLSTAQTATFTDNKSSAIKQRFYRVRAK